MARRGHPLVAVAARDARQVAAASADAKPLDRRLLCGVCRIDTGTRREPALRSSGEIV